MIVFALALLLGRWLVPKQTGEPRPRLNNQ